MSESGSFPRRIPGQRPMPLDWSDCWIRKICRRWEPRHNARMFIEVAFAAASARQNVIRAHTLRRDISFQPPALEQQTASVYGGPRAGLTRARRGGTTLQPSQDEFGGRMSRVRGASNHSSSHVRPLALTLESTSQADG